MKVASAAGRRYRAIKESEVTTFVLTWAPPVVAIAATYTVIAMLPKKKEEN